MPKNGVIVLCLLAACLAAPAAQAHDERGETLRKIAYYRTVTWRWQTPATGRAWRTESADVRREVLEAWKRVAAKTWRTALRPPHRAGWECIHRSEGPWDANTGNGYYGGLQMDLDFQRSYAPAFLLRKGTADRWSKLEQMWVAERAYLDRGFSPWPNTARACGLL
jgi:hypothetical protein